MAAQRQRKSSQTSVRTLAAVTENLSSSVIGQKNNEIKTAAYFIVSVASVSVASVIKKKSNKCELVMDIFDFRFWWMMVKMGGGGEENF